MTDYFDKSAKKASPAKVVSVSLAGVLAAGMVPAVAFAQAPEAQDEVTPISNEEISTIAVTAPDALKSATLATYVWSTDLNGEPDGSALSKDATNPTMAAPTSGAYPYLIPVTAKIGTSGNVVMATSVSTQDKNFVLSSNYSLETWMVTETGSTIPGTTNVKGTKVNAPSAAGTYYAVISAVGGDYKGGTAAFKYTIAAKEFTMSDFGLYLLSSPKGAESATALSTPTISYGFTNTALEFGLAAKGSGAFSSTGTAVSSSFYTLTVTDAGGNSVTPKNKGTYTVLITGKGAYAGSTVSKSITISSVTLQTAPASTANQAVVAFEPSVGTTLPTGVGDLSFAVGSAATPADLADFVTFTPPANGRPTTGETTVTGGTGVYTYTVKGKSGQQNVASNSAGPKFTLVSEMADITYKSAPLAGSYTVNLSDKKTPPSTLTRSKLTAEMLDTRLRQLSLAIPSL